MLKCTAFVRVCVCCFSLTFALLAAVVTRRQQTAWTQATQRELDALLFVTLSLSLFLPLLCPSGREKERNEQ